MKNKVMTVTPEDALVAPGGGGNLPSCVHHWFIEGTGGHGTCRKCGAETKFFTTAYLFMKSKGRVK